ncbi:hypothetical protein [Curtobacterium sp. MCSS17_016]|uniref:hypothetical protein n=1 Tax=Curtobacterium sp. MCSS17_016 TaxID=2175644 RepID=UPI000DA7558D|nr:hypothetical protein [Curtobacterium sp. MCSS17_016]WIE81174.1 hypothetical protein DEJ19_018245 [Curtobacterium sp. MCSS17_016]
MDDVNDIIRNQDLGIPGNGGEFAGHKKTEADASVTLTGSGTSGVRVGPYTVETSSLEPLPEWPEGIVRPDVVPQYSDSDGQISVAAMIGPVWVNTLELDGDVYLDDFDEAGAPDTWTDEDKAQITAYVTASHQRAKQVLGQVEYQATHNEAFSPALRALVNDEPVPATPHGALAQEDIEQATRLLDDLRSAVDQWNEDTNEGMNDDRRAYEQREDAQLAFADGAEALLNRLLGR